MITSNDIVDQLNAWLMERKVFLEDLSKLPDVLKHEYDLSKKRCTEAETEVRRLKTINADLSAQNEELRKGTTISPAEADDIARIRAEHADLKKSQDAIVVFLRKNFTADMEAGVNRGMSFAEMVCKYLGQAVVARNFSDAVERSKQ